MIEMIVFMGLIVFRVLLGLIVFQVSIVDLKYQDIFVDEDPLGLLQQPLFLDCSDLIMVVIVKWNCHSFYTSLLLVCGDINPNPGPASSFPCLVCGVEVLDVVKVVCCDSCDKWVHVRKYGKRFCS